ncbi:MAG: hypothetical protein PHJ00_03815 [Candidatus Omnitrophica bacterium]|nr:hypothetical protein [Candidatus Omnitrophota bacterium]
MAKYVRLCNEIYVTVSNKIGVLADISRVAEQLSINIEAVAGYATETDEARLLVVTFDNARLIQALKSKGYILIKEIEVLLIELENKVGSLEDMCSKLSAEDIDIKHIYGSTCPAGCPAQIVMSTSDNKKALAVLK